MKHYPLGMVWMLVLLIGSFGLASPNAAASSENLPDLQIELKAPQHVAPGNEYVINLSYSNLGSAVSAPDTWIKVSLPVGTQFLSAENQSGVDLPPVVIDESELSWEVGTIPADSCCQHIYITLMVAGDLADGTALEVWAEIGSSDEEFNLTNNTASVTSLVCEMAGSSKQVNAGEVKPGDTLTYTIQLRLSARNGMQATQERVVQLTDTPQFEHQLRFLGWEGPSPATWDGHTLRWQGRVRAGETLTLQYRFGVEGDVPPGTILRNSANIEWDGKMLQLGPVDSVVTMPQNAWMVGPLGYTWQYASGYGVDVPPDAVPELTRFEFRLMFTAGLPDAFPNGSQYAHRAMELNAFRFGEIHQFGEPIAIHVDVDPVLVNQYGRERLRFWYRNQEGEPWMRVGQQTWLDEDTLVFTTEHLTQFALFATTTYTLHLPYIRR